jgi:hypothetical protein
MNLALNAAPFDTIEESTSTSKRETAHNKTVKMDVVVPNKIATMRKHLVLDSMDAEDSGLVDFNPPSRPTSVGVERTKDRSNDDNDEPFEPDYTISSGLSTKLDETNYNEQYSPPHYGDHRAVDMNTPFINKLDYMIHLLEEQREIKTGSATEEVILYSFLGVFIIFVLDSFARAGRYTR